jgi:hypothetical protein
MLAPSQQVCDLILPERIKGKKERDCAFLTVFVALRGSRANGDSCTGAFYPFLLRESMIR